VDNEAIMSAAASAPVPPSVAELECWRSFAPGIPPDRVRAWIAKAVSRPQRSLKSDAAGVELRIQAADKLGLAAVLSKGEVQTAFPCVLGGHQVAVEILDVLSSPNELEGWVAGRWKGLLFTFFNVLHAVGREKLQKGEVREFVINAFAVSLREVKESVVDDAEAELEWPMRELRVYLARTGASPDRGIFQSPVEGDPQSLRCLGRTYTCLPISLAERERKRLTLDLVTAPELLDPAKARAGTELAGVLWLQGYLPELLNE
jgi:hypothetical protein